ncbi:contactin-2-like [Cyprinodon tularosa]|uniref:contactin-2-like n=1 Tax=Cyprinodon tularosa TaxID=77115 RepID=UPI0018E21AAC|nr:contactin-2-like [Cyprinodon tularosa]
MIPSRETQTSLLLILMLYFTASSDADLRLMVRVGDEVALACRSDFYIRGGCETITWLFTSTNPTVKLFETGQIHQEAAAKSDRLSVTADCSLVIKKVSLEDVGLYTCRKQGSDFNISLSVIHILQYLHLKARVGDEVTLPCENINHDCKTITWLFTSKSQTVKLFETGKIHQDAAAKSDRLSLTADCSLVIKKVSLEDAGIYACRQFINGQPGSTGSVFDSQSW